MDAVKFKNWRGYLYVALGVAFGFYRVSKVEQWGSWEYIDLLIALGMVGVGVFTILKK
ncbi:MAG: hypothetical protein R2820_00560 [Cyclobacteriaceae bacterium]|nr:hypothetical protein [Cyclobacteriaceae bacterium]